MVALAAEEEAEYRAQQRLAQTLSDGADDWRHTVRRTPPLQLAVVGLGLAGIALIFQETVFFALSILWFGCQMLLGFRPSFCRTTGAAALVLTLLAAVVSPGPGTLATPFFALPLCRNVSHGAHGLFGLNVPPDPSSGGVAACASSVPPAALEMPLAASALDLDRAYRPVLMVPEGAHASLTLSIEDAAGRTLYPRTRLELGPEDEFPWARVLSRAGEAVPSVPWPAPSTAALADGTMVAGAHGAAAAHALPVVGGGGTVFAASSRRNRRRLRGMMRLGGGMTGMGRMGGGGFGGGFSRGSGSFMNARRGVSQGPSQFGRGPTSALGRGGAHPAGVAGGVGRPGTTYFHQGPYVGGGYVPTMGYHPSLGYDIATVSYLRPHARRLSTPTLAARARRARACLAALDRRACSLSCRDRRLAPRTPPIERRPRAHGTASERASERGGGSWWRVVLVGGERDELLPPFVSRPPPPVPCRG